MKFQLEFLAYRLSPLCVIAGKRSFNLSKITIAGINPVRNYVKKKMPPIPDRWDNYCPVGKVIPRTKFIAFKVPLKEAFLQDVKEEDQFSPDILMKSLEEQEMKLGLVIDLTFTTKYYNVKEFEDQSVLHKKVFVRGHFVPDDSNFQEFVEAVKDFDKDDHVIGVHCTHGVNRTGYLICRYMIEEMDFEPEEAISLFKEARGHGIERENYLEDLSQRKKGLSSVTVRPLSERIDSDSTKKKPRWRENRDNHPGWRKNHRHQHQPYRNEQWKDNHGNREMHTSSSDYNNSNGGETQEHNSHSENPDYHSHNGHISEYNPRPRYHEQDRYRDSGWGYHNSQREDGRGDRYRRGQSSQRGWHGEGNSYRSAGWGRSDSGWGSSAQERDYDNNGYRDRESIRGGEDYGQFGRKEY